MGVKDFTTLQMKFNCKKQSISGLGHLGGRNQVPYVDQESISNLDSSIESLFIFL